jgi:hypothetical protein
MVSIGTCPVTDEFPVDRGISIQRVLELFQNHDTRTVTEYEAIPVTVPRSTGKLGLFVSSG